MADEIIIETTSQEVIEVGTPGPQGPAGAAGTGLETLTTRGDTLYRGTTTGERLPIGTAGQILKVSAGGIPEWGAAPASGVSSVNGETGAVTLDAADVGAAATNHSHQPSAIYCDAVDVADTTLSSGEPNGIYFRDGSDNGKAIYKSAQGYALWWDEGEEEWVLGNVPQTAKYYIGTGNTEYPWQATAWALGPQGSGDTPVIDQALLSNLQRNAAQDAISTRTPKTGNASSTEVVLGSDTRLTNARTPSAHTHPASAITDFSAAASAAAPVQSVAGRTGAVTLAVADVTNAVATSDSRIADISANSITTKQGANSGGAGGTITMRGGITGAEGPGGNAGSINLRGSDDRSEGAFNGGSIDLSGFSGTGGSITSTGNSEGAGGSLNMSGNSFAGGSINTSGGGSGVGGSIDTSNDGGSINTRGTGSIGFGANGTRTTLTGTATANRAIDLPDASGTLALTSQLVTGAASSAADVLGVSGANITGVDAGSADRLVMWDDSASKLTYLEAGSGLSISGTTLTATASGSSKTCAVFTTEHNQPPASAFATLDTRNSIAVLDFDAATDENAVFVGIMPEAASLGSGLIVRLHWMATSATSGNVRWGVQFERSNTDLDTDSFDTAVEATAAAANGTSGILTTTAITVTTIDGITAGDVFRLKVFRNADDATNDTMTGDAELVAVEVRSAA